MKPSPRLPDRLNTTCKLFHTVDFGLLQHPNWLVAHLAQPSWWQMADMMSARSLQVMHQHEKEMTMAEGGDRLAVLNRSERLAEEKERVLRECAPVQRCDCSTHTYSCYCQCRGQRSSTHAALCLWSTTQSRLALNCPPAQSCQPTAHLAVRQEAVPKVQCAACAGTSRRTRGACAA